MLTRISAHAIDQRRSSKFWRSSAEICDDSGDELGFIRLRQPRPSRARIRTRDGNPGKSGTGAETCSEFAGEVKQQSFGASVLMLLSHAVFVVA